VSPQVGAGFVYGYPYNWSEGLGSTPRCGFAHYDVGADFTPDSVFTFSTGLTVADVDCSTSTQILPLPYVGIAWYLGR
jgi:hypothetical protein